MTCCTEGVNSHRWTAVSVVKCYGGVRTGTVETRQGDVTSSCSRPYWLRHVFETRRSFVSVRACVRACVFSRSRSSFRACFRASVPWFMSAFVFPFLFSCFRSLVHAWFSWLLSFFCSLVHGCFRTSFPSFMRSFGACFLPFLGSRVLSWFRSVYRACIRASLLPPSALRPLRSLQSLHESLRSARDGEQLICNGTYWRHDITRGDNCWIRDTY